MSKHASKIKEDEKHTYRHSFIPFDLFIIPTFSHIL